MAFNKFGVYDTLEQIPFASAKSVDIYQCVSDVYTMCAIFCWVNLSEDQHLAVQNVFWVDGIADVPGLVGQLRTLGWGGPIRHEHKVETSVSVEIPAVAA